MIFMVLVGGLGTFEGPILGAIVFFVIQYEFADQGAWYLIGLGRGRHGLRAVPAPRPVEPADRPAARPAAAGRIPAAANRPAGRDNDVRAAGCRDPSPEGRVTSLWQPAAPRPRRRPPATAPALLTSTSRVHRRPVGRVGQRPRVREPSPVGRARRSARSLPGATRTRTSRSTRRTPPSRRGRPRAPRARRRLPAVRRRRRARAGTQFIAALAAETGCGRHFAGVQVDFAVVAAAAGRRALPYAPSGQVLPVRRRRHPSAGDAPARRRRRRDRALERLADPLGPGHRRAPRARQHRRAQAVRGVAVHRRRGVGRAASRRPACRPASSTS